MYDCLHDYVVATIEFQKCFDNAEIYGYRILHDYPNENFRGISNNFDVSVWKLRTLENTTDTDEAFIAWLPFPTHLPGSFIISWFAKHLQVGLPGPLRVGQQDDGTLGQTAVSPSTRQARLPRHLLPRGDHLQ